MFYEEAMKTLRETHDCSDIDRNRKLPVFVFHVFKKINNQWEKIEGEFYADTPLEAIDQASSLFSIRSTMKAICVKACNYFMDEEGPHVILDKHTRNLISGGDYYQHYKNHFPSLEEFITNILKRRKEMKMEGLL